MFFICLFFISVCCGRNDWLHVKNFIIYQELNSFLIALCLLVWLDYSYWLSRGFVFLYSNLQI